MRYWILIATGLILVVTAVLVLFDPAAAVASPSSTQHQVADVAQAVAQLQDCAICHAQPARPAPPVASVAIMIAAEAQEPVLPPGATVQMIQHDPATPLDVRLAGVGQRLLDVADEGVPTADVSQAMADFLTLAATITAGDTIQPSSTILQRLIALEAVLADLEQQARSTQHWQAPSGLVSPHHALVLNIAGAGIPLLLDSEAVELVLPPPLRRFVWADEGVFDPVQMAFAQSRRGPPAVAPIDSLDSFEKGDCRL